MAQSKNRSIIDSAVGAIALFGGVAVLVGYIFQVGFIYGFDHRLFQFFSVEDYVTASAAYVFAIPVAIVAAAGGNLFALIGGDDSAPRDTLFDQLFRKEGALPLDIKLKLRTVARVISAVATCCFLIGLVGVLKPVWQMWKPAENLGSILINATLILMLPGLALVAMFDLGRVRNRRLVAIAALVLFAFSLMYFYGEFEGRRVRAATVSDFEVELVAGRHVRGVLVRKLSEGLVYKLAGNDSLYYIPESDMRVIHIIAPPQ